MVGITRIVITDGQRKDWRFKLASACSPFANSVYRQMFDSVGMPLATGESVEYVKKEDLKGRYDWEEGIDIILIFADGTRGTMQEKILFTTYTTATFEERKNSGKHGAWYTCTAQYYAVLYTVEDRIHLTRMLGTDKFKVTIREGVIYNLPSVHQQSMNGNIAWKGNRNHRDGRRSPFRFFKFKDSPSNVTVAAYKTEAIQESSYIGGEKVVAKPAPLMPARQMTLLPELRQTSLFEGKIDTSPDTPTKSSTDGDAA